MARPQQPGGFCLNHFRKVLGRRGVLSERNLRSTRRDTMRIRTWACLWQRQGTCEKCGPDSFITASYQGQRRRWAEPMKLLEQVFAEHPEIKAEMPEIEERIQACRAAVKAVGEFQQQIRRANESRGSKVTACDDLPVTADAACAGAGVNRPPRADKYWDMGGSEAGQQAAIPQSEVISGACRSSYIQEKRRFSDRTPSSCACTVGSGTPTRLPRGAGGANGPRNS